MELATPYLEALLLQKQQKVIYSSPLSLRTYASTQGSIQHYKQWPQFYMNEGITGA